MNSPRPFTISLWNFLEKMEEVREAEIEEIKIKPTKEGAESWVNLSAHSAAAEGTPWLVNDFQEMIKKYLVQQVGIPNVKKVEATVIKIF